LRDAGAPGPPVAKARELSAVFTAESAALTKLTD
jgi:hypothetical protein